MEITDHVYEPQIGPHWRQLPSGRLIWVVGRGLCRRCLADGMYALGKAHQDRNDVTPPQA